MIHNRVHLSMNKNDDEYIHHTESEINQKRINKALLEALLSIDEINIEDLRTSHNETDIQFFDNLRLSTDGEDGIKIDDNNDSYNKSHAVKQSLPINAAFHNIPATPITIKKSDHNMMWNSKKLPQPKITATRFTVKKSDHNIIWNFKKIPPPKIAATCFYVSKGMLHFDIPINMIIEGLKHLTTCIVWWFVFLCVLIENRTSKKKNQN